MAIFTYIVWHPLITDLGACKPSSCAPSRSIPSARLLVDWVCNGLSKGGGGVSGWGGGTHLYSTWSHRPGWAQTHCKPASLVQHKYVQLYTYRWSDETLEALNSSLLRLFTQSFTLNHHYFFKQNLHLTLHWFYFLKGFHRLTLHCHYFKVTLPTVCSVHWNNVFHTN